MTQRVQDLQGIPNFRDLGGYPTADGGRVRWGRVYRSAKLSRATPAGLSALDALGMASVFDLRTAEERAAEPTRWLRAPGAVYESPKATMRPLMDDILRHAFDEPTTVRAMADFYAQIPLLFAEEFGALFRALAAGGTPLLLHCAAGKDRTGVASALLLSALGVPREIIAQDYVLTEQLLDAGRQALMHETIAGPPSMSSHMAAKPLSVQVTLWRALPEFLDPALASVDQRYGSVANYLLQALGLDPQELQKLRDHLVE